MSVNLIIQLGKLFNKGDGLICLTGGRLSTFSGHRYPFLMVGQTNAKSMPRQQSLINGQMASN